MGHDPAAREAWRTRINTVRLPVPQSVLLRLWGTRRLPGRQRRRRRRTRLCTASVHKHACSSCECIASRRCYGELAARTYLDKDLMHSVAHALLLVPAFNTCAAERAAAAAAARVAERC
jgi:hypothetical protein